MATEPNRPRNVPSVSDANRRVAPHLDAAEREAAIRAFIDATLADPVLGPNLVHQEHNDEREAQYAEFPADLDPRIITALAKRGIPRLYTHQAEAIALACAGKHVAQVTPTASGKSLGYNLPVLDAIVKAREENPPRDVKALYLFPTKALSQDQVNAIREIAAEIENAGEAIASYTYDGDTPTTTRRTLREKGDLVITNPYMLHTGILPNHPKWVTLFQNLRFVIIDEVHSYRGIFGSHVANLIRRLKRICAHYGSKPQFLMASATIGNPKEHAEALIGDAVECVTESGAPQGARHHLFYNPPVVVPEMGLRRAALEEVRVLAGRFLLDGIQTIYFVRSRTEVEILTKYLKDFLHEHNRNPELVVGYRGGYLPGTRRDIEQGLREGSIVGVVSTNALELGVDIGSLDCCFLTGYPGSVASFYQQSGRAGRRNGLSLACFVGRGSALDQYVLNHPDYVFGGSQEEALIDADNAIILTNHVKCSAFEIPFKSGEAYPGHAWSETKEILEFLQFDGRLLHENRGTYYWAAEAYPAEGVSLNAADVDNFVIYDEDKREIIGEIDRPSAMTLIHEGAIFGVQGEQFLITKLEYDERKVWARPSREEYYTQAETDTTVRILHVDQETATVADERPTLPGTARPPKNSRATFYQGDVEVTTTATYYKKIKYYTRENLGAGEIHMPAEVMDTTSTWIVFADDLASEVDLYHRDNASGLTAVANLLRNAVPLIVRTDPRDFRVYAETRSPVYGSPVIFLYDGMPAGAGLAERIYERRARILELMAEMVTDCPCPMGCPACVGPYVDMGGNAKTTALYLIEALLGDAPSDPTVKVR